MNLLFLCSFTVKNSVDSRERMDFFIMKFHIAYFMCS